MSPAEVYFSIDIEADGPYPGDYSMSALGAVCVGVLLRDGSMLREDVDNETNHFYLELKPISENFDPEAAAVAGLDRDILIETGASAEDAMASFNRWVLDTTARVAFEAGEERGRAIFVGWPLTFDWLWIYWYLMKFNGSSPFGFSGAIDMKSWYAARAGVTLAQTNKGQVYSATGAKRLPHTHNALDDAKEQGVLWQSLAEWSKK